MHLNSEIGVAVENLPANSNNLLLLKNYIEELSKNSTLWGSSEWKEIRNHQKNKVVIIIEKFVTKIICALNLVPLL